MLFGNHIAPVHTVRDLGVMLVSNMTMSEHVLRVCQNCYFQLRLIHRLGKALSVVSKLLLVHAFIVSWITVIVFSRFALVFCPAASVRVKFYCAFDFWLEAILSHCTCPDGFALASIPTAHYILCAVVV